MIRYQLVPTGALQSRKHSVLPICCCIFALVLIVSFVVVYGAMNGLAAVESDSDNLELTRDFEAFAQTYGKSYKSSYEKERRKAVFAANWAKISEINAQQLSYTLGINQFADLSDEEFATTYLTESPVPADVSKFSQQLPASLPLSAAELADDEIDWVKDGLVNPVKDQGLCGSCWTFGTVSTVESRYAKVEGKLKAFSEQQLVDCCRTEDSKGCSGGQVEDGVPCLVRTGAALLSDYPYMAFDQSCKLDGSIPTTKVAEGFTTVATLDTAQMQRALKNHTMYVSVNAGAFAFRFYKSGVVTEGCPSAPLSHGVTLVGSGTRDGVAYWKVRNSWGPNWGESGYISILRDVSQSGPGQCGIARHVVYPNYKE